MAAMFDGGGFYNSAPGGLPWGAGSNPIAATSRESVASSYGQNYQNALDMNKANYNNILSGYTQALAAQQRAQASIGAGYSGLQDQVLGDIQNIGQSQNQAIMDQYAAAMGKQSQQLIDRGLGNTTVQSSVARGNLLDRTKSLNDNNERIAGLRAKYRSDLGLQGLGAQREFYQANTGLLGRQLDWQNSVNAAYPDANMYAGLVSQFGDERDGRGGQAPPPGYGGAAPGLGYQPRSAPGYYSSGRDPGVQGVGAGGGSSWMLGQYTAPASAGYSSPYAAADYGGGGDFGGYGGDTGGGGDYAYMPSQDYGSYGEW